MNRAATAFPSIALAEAGFARRSRAARWRRQAWPAEAIAREGLETLSGFPLRCRVWEPSQGSHYYVILYQPSMQTDVTATHTMAMFRDAFSWSGTTCASS